MIQYAGPMGFTRVPEAVMAESSRVPRVQQGNGMTEYSRVLRVQGPEMTGRAAYNNIHLCAHVETQHTPTPVS